MVIIKVLSGNENVHSLTRALSEILNSDNLKMVTPFDDKFILTKNSTELHWLPQKGVLFPLTHLVATARSHSHLGRQNLAPMHSPRVSTIGFDYQTCHFTAGIGTQLCPCYVRSEILFKCKKEKSLSR